MILVGTKLKVSDNSGAKIIECIKILGKPSSSFASIGDIIVVSVKELSGKNKQNRKVEKGGVYKALITETKKGIRRKDGSTIQFNRNAALLLSEQGNPLGTRILGTLTYELRKKNQTKALSLASRVL